MTYLPREVRASCGKAALSEETPEGNGQAPSRYQGRVFRAGLGRKASGPGERLTLQMTLFSLSSPEGDHLGGSPSQFPCSAGGPPRCAPPASALLYRMTAIYHDLARVHVAPSGPKWALGGWLHFSGWSFSIDRLGGPMGLRPVSLETQAEIVFKEAKRVSPLWPGALAQPCLLTAAPASSLGQVASLELRARPLPRPPGPAGAPVSRPSQVLGGSSADIGPRWCGSGQRFGPLRLAPPPRAATPQVHTTSAMGSETS